MLRPRSRSALTLALVTTLLLPAAAAADVTSTVVTSPATQLVHGQTTTLTATVTNTTTPAKKPTGNVQLRLDGAAVGAPVALSAAGTAKLVTPRLRAGARTLEADYLGATGFDASDDSITLTVARATTRTNVTLTPSAGAVSGQDLGFDVKIAPTTTPLGAPTGTIALSAFGAQIMQSPLAPDGSVSGFLRLPALSADATVGYSGDASYAPSQTTFTVTIGKAGTTIVLSASPATATVGQPVTFTATIDSLAPSMWWPSGQLNSAIDGQAVPGVVTLDGSGLGSAQFTQAFSTPGVHHVTAHFTGDADFAASDAALDVTITGTAATPRTTPRGLSVKASPKRDRRAPYRFTIAGRLQLPSGVTAQGKVIVDAKVKGKRVARKSATVDGAGRYKAAITLKRKGTAKITARFAGDDLVAAVTSRAVAVRAG